MAEDAKDKLVVAKKGRKISFLMHLRTLLWKNSVIKRRHWVATILEVLLPVLFILLMSGLKTLTSDVSVPAGWSDTATSSWDDSVGTSYSLLTPYGYYSGNLGIPNELPLIISPLQTHYSSANKYLVQEPSMSGLLMYLGVKTVQDMTYEKSKSNPTDQEKSCLVKIGFFGYVSTDTSSANAIPDDCRDKVSPYKLAIAPDTEFTRNYFFETMKLWYPRVEITNNTVDSTSERIAIPAFEDSIKFFDTEADLEDYIGDKNYGKSIDSPKIYGAVVFDQYPEGDSIGKYSSIEYSLRFNSTQGKGGSPGVVPRTLGDPAFELPFSHALDTTYLNLYALRGFMTLQTMVTRFVNCMPHWDSSTNTTNGTCNHDLSTADTTNDDLLFKTLQHDFFLDMGLPYMYGGMSDKAWDEFNAMDASSKEALLVPLRQAPQPYFGTSVAPLPIETYVSAPFYDAISNVFPLVFILAYLYAISRVLVVLIQEKETRSREYMKILGVEENTIILSWYLTYFFIFFIGCVLQALVSKAGLFGNSDPVLIFIFFYLFSASVLAFGFLISTLFSRSRTGAFAGMVLFFVMYFVSSGFSASSSKQSKSGACILSPVALAFGVQSLANAEASGVGMNFANAKTEANNFSFDVSLGMMLFDTILYTLLGLYFERVVPREYGTVEKWYFPIQPSYWKRKISHKVSDVLYMNADVPVDIDASTIEPVSHELQQQERTGEALVIRNIKKEFAVPGGIKRAVKGVSLTMYRDQVTCLLGHNGAGKTTLISMLTGMIAPSEGDAFIHGYSLTHDMKEIRKSLGLCFQHDVLYAEMTVEEHLKFYGRLKGYKGKELAEVVTTKIREVGLTEKRRVFSGSLSGGMKRKLSVAISLLGDSSLVFLDEPTSGMDPYSRRSTWEILLNNRQNRVMVLTTHFMDEADILGDRIAIMAEGELRCCGSSMFLKNRYGAGYNFTLVKEENCDEQKLVSVVMARVPSAKILSSVGAEIAFQLPVDATGAFADLFETLDARLDDLGVLSYGISVTTLEEVFIKVAEAGDETNQHTLKKDADDHPTVSPGGSSGGPAIANLTGWVMFFVHLSALLLKRFRIAKRDRRVVLFSAILPVTLLGAGLGILKSSSLTKSDVKLALTTDDLLTGVDNSIPFFCHNDTDEWCSNVMRSSLFTGGNPHTFGSSDFSTPPFDSSVSPAVTYTVFNVSYSSTDLENLDPDGYCLRMGEKVYQRAFGKTDADMDSSTVTPVTGQYAAYLVHGSGDDHLLGYHLFVNTTATHGAVIFKALIDQAIYRFMALAGNIDDSTAASDITLKVNTYPLPMTATTKAVFGSFLAFTACLFIVIAFAFFPASIVTFLVKEKQAEHNSKHQQLVSGVSLPAFWVSNYMWDLTTYVIPFIAAIVMIKAFNISAFTGDDSCVSCTASTFSAVVLLFVLFGLAICPFTYVMSYFFKEHASSQTYTIIANFLLGVVLMVVSFILDVVSDSSADANKVLKYFWRLSPLFNLGSGLLNQALNEIGATLRGSTEKKSAFDMDIMGWELLYLALDAILFFSCAIGFDFLLSFPKIKAAIFKDPKLPEPSLEDEDEDVKREAERVMSGGADGDMVKLVKLRKVYKGNKVAVRNLSFGLPKGECFGYLGINGAGKTTTMKMMTGDILPTSGAGALGGLDILSQQIEVRRLIGYCPQFDALFELLSVREHLELFASIKGVRRSELNTVVRGLMHQMNLDDFEHKLAGTLSGGNKRKLSVAIALIGSPPIIFLDEPSTGMDPVSRRFMWNVIAQISTQRKESTIILTTHSMEECEALCTRVGIMVGGRLRCLGSIQHLKHRFGDGLMVELKLEQATTAVIEERVTSAFPDHGTPRAPDAVGSGDRTFPKSELRAKCELLGHGDWADKITMGHPTGYALATAMERDGTLRLGMLTAWWIAEERFLALDAFLKSCFGDASATPSSGAQLLERQNDMCRYKLKGSKEQLRLSHVFKQIEGGKSASHVREYAVSQTTLEQIFNFFASQQSEEKGVARGLGGNPASYGKDPAVVDFLLHTQ